MSKRCLFLCDSKCYNLAKARENFSGLAKEKAKTGFYLDNMCKNCNHYQGVKCQSSQKNLKSD